MSTFTLFLLTLTWFPLVLNAKIHWQPIAALKQTLCNQSDLRELYKLVNEKNTPNLWIAGTRDPDSLKPLIKSLSFKKIVISESDNKLFFHAQRTIKLNKKTTLLNSSPETLTTPFPLNLVLVNHSLDQKLPFEKRVSLESCLSNISKHLKKHGIVAGVITTYDQDTYHEATLKAINNVPFTDALADFPEPSGNITLGDMETQLKQTGFLIQTLKLNRKEKDFINEETFVNYLRAVSLEYRWIAHKNIRLAERFIHCLSDEYRQLTQSNKKSLSIAENQIIFVAKKAGS
jgi:hypothetical protein